mmetsp:Transcript_21711/g.69912  ORF Transcript_21711/g.69912 Transcript_21711/m.69912 type:complete len:245 (-) Transcript_21711:63-797(-)
MRLRSVAEECARGGVVFWACGASSQLLQGMVGVTTRTALAPPLVNVATVGVASVLAYRWSRREALFDSGGDAFDVRAVACGLAIFAVLGGRWLSLTPSNVVSVGAFGRRAASIPALAAYATKAQRLEIAKLGKTFGCHSCGRKGGLPFVADHQPPLKLTRWRKKFLPFFKPTYRFYPQCADCSSCQGAALRKTTVSPVKLHLRKLRLYHATGALVRPAADALLPAIEDLLGAPGVGRHVARRSS